MNNKISKNLYLTE